MAAPCELVVAMGRVGRDASAMAYQRVVVVWAAPIHWRTPESMSSTDAIAPNVLPDAPSLVPLADNKRGPVSAPLPSAAP
jgi:hypothetical protein